MRIIILAFILVGCTHMGSKQAQNDIYNLQARILHVEQSLKLKRGSVSGGAAGGGSRLADVSSQVSSMEQTINRLRGEMDTIKSTDYSSASKDGESSYDSDRIQNLNQRLAILEKSQKLILSQLTLLGKRNVGATTAARPTQPARSNKTAKVSTPSLPISDYNTLKAAYARKEYSKIVTSGNTVLSSLDGDQKTMSTFYMADSYYHIKNFRKAAINFSDYLETSSNSKRSATAKLKLADCFLQLGDHETARIYLDEIVEKHAKTREAKLANDILKDLDKKSF